MKIRLAIIDSDENYVKRLVSNFQINYAEKIEPYFFSTYELFLNFYRNNRVHVILADENLPVEQEQIPQDISFAWLVSDNAVERLEGYPAVGKFQKAELLYKEVLSLYADVESRMVFRRGKKGKCIVFVSPQGGVGTSTVAAAYALHTARQGYKSLYLSLDVFNKSELYFHGDGNLGFSDVIYALKTKKSNLALKLESISKKDGRGVLYFDSCKNAGDMLEVKPEDIDLLFPALNSMESVEYLVVDLPLEFSDVCNVVLEKYADIIVILNDGSTAGEVKFKQAMEILLGPEKQKENLKMKLRLLYNKLDYAESKKMSDPQIDTLGELELVHMADPGQIAESLSKYPAMKQME